MVTTIDIRAIPDYVAAVTDTGEIRLPADNGGFAAGDISVQIQNCKITVTAGETPVKFIRLRWHGSFSRGVRVLGDAIERGYGSFEWRSLMPSWYMPWYFFASDTVSTTGFGVMTQPDTLVFWQSDTDGVSLLLDMRCGTHGVILGGKQLHVTLVTASNTEGESAFMFAKRFCRMMCPNPLMPDKPVYGGNDWYYAYGKTSAEGVMEEVKIIAMLADGLENRPYMILDDGWQQSAPEVSCSGRPYFKGNKTFPQMDEFAARIRAEGVRPAIWCRPIYSLYDKDPEYIRSQHNRVYFDITEPETHAIVASDIDRLTGEWGYEMVKYDFTAYDTFDAWGNTAEDYLQMPGDWTWHDKSVTNAQATKSLYSTIYEHSHGAVLIGCNVLSHLAAGYIHQHRSGDDTSGFDWNRTYHMGVNTLAFRLPQHGAFYSCDADNVGITEQIPWKLNSEMVRLISMSGTPLIVSLKPSEVRPEIVSELKTAFRRASEAKDVMEPLDWFDTTHPVEYMVNGNIERFKLLPDCGMTGLFRK